MTRAQIHTALLLVIFLIATAYVMAEEKPRCEGPGFEELAGELFERFEFKKLYELSLPCAEAGDPEIQFGVGILIGETGEEQIGEFGEAERQQMALGWFRKAAVSGLEQAQTQLAVSYTHGWYGLAENEELANCWRSTATEEGRVEDCLELERDIEGR